MQKRPTELLLPPLLLAKLLYESSEEAFLSPTPLNRRLQSRWSDSGGEEEAASLLGRLFPPSQCADLGYTAINSFFRPNGKLNPWAIHPWKIFPRVIFSNCLLAKVLEAKPGSLAAFTSRAGLLVHSVAC